MHPFDASNRATPVDPDPPTRDREACGSGFASLHVLMTVNSAWNIWNFRRPVVSALLADGHTVTVLAPPDDSVPLLQGMGCRFEPLAMDVKGLNPLRSLALIRRLRRNFTELRPDVVLGYTIKNNLFGAMAARRVGVPLIPNVTGLGTAFLSNGPLQRIAEALYRHAFAGLPCVFFQNDEDRGLFLHRRLVREPQARLLPGSGIDLDHFTPQPLPSAGEATTFLMIARLLRDKGVVEYVEAARLLRHKFPAARFRLLGAAGSKNRSAVGPGTVAAWQAEGVIDYLGTADDVRPHITAADCVVLPSYREGAPRSLLEAAAMARPIITTDSIGCRDIVEDGVTGFLCRSRDSTDLAAKMETMIALTSAERDTMGQAGRRRMERFYDVQIVIDRYLTAIQELAQPQAAKSAT